MIKEVPTKNFQDGDEWLLLSRVLGRRVTFRADTIKKCKKRQKDFDDHECDEAYARSSVKCKSRVISVGDKILQK